MTSRASSPKSVGSGRRSSEPASSSRRSPGTIRLMTTGRTGTRAPATRRWRVPAALIALSAVPVAAMRKVHRALLEFVAEARNAEEVKLLRESP